MKELKRLNIHQMIWLVTFKANDFNPTNTGVDLSIHSGHINTTMRLIESYFGFAIFLRGKTSFYTKGNGVLGFTNKGLEVYIIIKKFLDSIMLVGLKTDNSKGSKT